jgi:hypothetical protein
MKAKASAKTKAKPAQAPAENWGACSSCSKIRRLVLNAEGASVAVVHRFYVIYDRKMSLCPGSLRPPLSLAADEPDDEDGG